MFKAISFLLEHWPLAILVNSVKLIDTGVLLITVRGLTPKFQDDSDDNVKLNQWPDTLSYSLFVVNMSEIEFISFSINWKWSKYDSNLNIDINIIVH